MVQHRTYIAPADHAANAFTDYDDTDAGGGGGPDDGDDDGAEDDGGRRW